MMEHGPLHDAGIGMEEPQGGRRDKQSVVSATTAGVPLWGTPPPFNDASIRLRSADLPEPAAPPATEARYSAWWMPESCQEPPPTGRVYVQNSSNLTGSVLLPEITSPDSMIV